MLGRIKVLACLLCAILTPFASLTVDAKANSLAARPNLLLIVVDIIDWR